MLYRSRRTSHPLDPEPAVPAAHIHRNGAASRFWTLQLVAGIDVGGGDGRLRRCLPDGWPAAVVAASPTQLARAPHPKVRGDALQLPLRADSTGAVCMLWMLYPLETPLQAIREAKRVLRPGGLFVASNAARNTCPELTDDSPPSTFGAEEAEGLVAEIFDHVETERWDAPMTHVLDQDAVKCFCPYPSARSE